MRCRRSILWSAAMMLSVIIGLAPAAGASTQVVPSTIDATGTSDVTDALVAFIANVPDGSTITFPAGAHYRVDGSLTISGRNDLTFEGNGAEFFTTTEADRNRRHWWIRNSDGITIRNVVIRGANPNAGLDDDAYQVDREAQHGIELDGVKNALLEGVTVTDVYGDFVYIGRDTSGWSQNVTVQDSRFERNGRQGISITAGENIRIERNTITDVRRSTFDIEPNGAGWGARHVTIADNDIGPGRLNFLAGHGYAAPVDDIVVSGNRLKGKTMNISLSAPASKRRTNFSLIGNVSDAPFGSSIAAVTINGFDGVTIRDNVLPLAAGRNMTAVGLRSTCNAVVANNQFLNAANDVSNDGYNCEKAGPPTTTAASPSATDSHSSTTTIRAAAGATTPTRGAPAVGNGPAATAAGETASGDVPAGRAATAGSKGSDGSGSESAAPAARDDGRLVDPSAPGRGRDNAVWVLVLGALVSVAILVPVSRRRR